MTYFVNWSNHPFDEWSTEQVSAAKDIGELQYLPFPDVDPDSSSEDIEIFAQDLMKEFSTRYPDPSSVVVMVQGEMTLLYHILRLMEEKGYRAVAATSIRNTILLSDGREIKAFRFNKFRDYFITTPKP